MALSGHHNCADECPAFGGKADNRRSQTSIYEAQLLTHSIADIPKRGLKRLPKALHRRMLKLSNRTHIGVIEENREVVLPVATLCQRYGVDALIRLSAEDYDLLPVRGRFVHFNLEITLNEVGKHYALLPILRQGRRDSDGSEILPIIDQYRYRVATCEEVRQRVDLREITTEHFTQSLPNIRNVAELESALIRRYAPMFPELSAQKRLARGCAVTSLMLGSQIRRGLGAPLSPSLVAKGERSGSG